MFWNKQTEKKKQTKQNKNKNKHKGGKKQTDKQNK